MKRKRCSLRIRGIDEIGCILVFPLTVFSILVLSCGTEKVEPSIEETQGNLFRSAEDELQETEAIAMRSAEVDDSGPEDHLEWSNPFMKLSDLEGPIPLFESLDDDQGRRYVIGMSVSDETGDEIGTKPSTTRFSGVWTMDRKQVDGLPSDGEKKDSPIEFEKVKKISDELAAVIHADVSGGKDTMIIDVRLHNKDTGMQHELNRRMTQGIIVDRESYLSERDKLVLDKRGEIASKLTDFVEDVKQRRGQVVYQGKSIAFARIKLPLSQISELSERADILQMDIPKTVVLDGVDGVEVRYGAQYEQLISSGFDGNGISNVDENDNIVVSIIEPGSTTGFDDDHGGFREGSPSSYFRFAGQSGGKWHCTGSGCNAISGWTATSNHATGAAGILMGDLIQGQISTIPSSDRVGGSGYAGEARGHLLTFASQTSAVMAFDHIRNLTSNEEPPHLISNSWGYIHNCSGTSSVSFAANQLYLDGVAVFSAAGNGGGSSSDCTVHAPGDAIGVFTAGAHMHDSNSPNGDARDVRTAAIYDLGGNVSAWGGNTTEGQNRSLVDLTAPGRRQKEFINGSAISTGDGGICCTSLATPTLAAAGAMTMDFFNGGSYAAFIDNPGALYSVLLLMGDRQTSSGKIGSNPDHRWGAGRIRARMFNSTGMDTPWKWGMYTTCISSWEVHDLSIASSPLSSDYETLKASMYWYDYNHASSGSRVKDVDLHLVDLDSGVQIASDTDSYDNKATIYHSNVGGRRLALRLRGYNISGHTDPVCGANSVQVWFAYFAEDSDRESPTYNSGNGQGVFPESL